MKNYEKPTIDVCQMRYEGVYAASGDMAASGSNGDGGVKCDSIYMKGVWQAPDYSNWAPGETRGYKQVFACLGCPANTDSGCGLLTHYVESGNASSYDVDNGNRKPSWEKKGYGPNDVVTDWHLSDN